MSQLSREAWKAYFRGDYLRAGDLYKAAGLEEKALKMYLKGGALSAASQVEETLGRVSQGVDHLLRAGDPTSAAQMLARHGQFGRAAQIMGDSGNKFQAAQLALKGGHTTLAAQYLEQSGRYLDAGRLHFQGGNVERALLLFEKAVKSLPSMDLLTASDQLQQREQLTEIARFFEEGQAYTRAAEVHESLNNAMQAAQCYEAAKQYTKAMELYQRAGAMDRVSALVDREENTPTELRAEALLAKGETGEAALLFVKAGRKERAAELLEKAGNVAGAAELRREMGDYEAAGNLFFRAQAFLPAAESFQQAGLHGMAKQCYLEAGDLGLACRMAYEAGDWEEAVELAASREDREYLLKRLQALPEGRELQARIGVLKARLFIELDQPELARVCLDGLPASSGAEDLWRLYLLGRTREAEGSLDEASSAYRQVMAQDVSFRDVKSRLEGLKRQPQAAAPLKDERYRAVRPRGRDAFGPWFEGEDGSLRLSVLIHTARTPRSGDPLSAQEGFQVRLELRHPAILSLRDVVPGGDETILVYESFEGRPLSGWLGEGYAPSAYGAVDKLRQCLEALAEAHRRGAVHGHVSPDAVFMDGEGRIKIHGFGLMGAWRDLEPSPEREALRPYLAPEVLAGGAPTVRSDLFGAGALFVRLVTGASPDRPKEGEASASADPLQGASVAENVRALVLKLLKVQPDGRYADATEALQDLAAQELPPGSVIAGRYEVLEELGRGGMGQVFRVRDRELDEVIALKTLRRRPDLSEQARSRFLREIKLTRKITHPNVVRVFDLGAWRDLSFITMEYIPGRTLSQWVRDGEGKNANLRQKVEILRAVAAGLAEAHKLGIIHRDLKPQNVILTPSGIPKLLDFGIAYTEAEGNEELTQEGHFVGSPKYVSPEQIQGLPLDSRSDIYCLGLLAYFLLTGHDAFTGDKPSMILIKQLKEPPLPPSRLVRLPPSLESLVLKCLNKKPDDRPSDLAEVSRTLKEIV